MAGNIEEHSDAKVGPLAFPLILEQLNFIIKK